MVICTMNCERLFATTTAHTLTLLFGVNEFEYELMVLDNMILSAL
jgi:hypothetical protein